MLVNNYWIWAAYTATHLLNGSSVAYSDIGLRYTDGSIFYFLTQGSVSYYQDNWITKYNLSLVLGDDDTTPTIDDYYIQGTNLNSVFANISTTYNVGPILTSETAGLSTVFTMTGTNATAQDQTIQEVAVMKGLTGYPAGSSGGSYSICIAREVLDTPIVVPAGRGFTLTFDWKEEYPL